MPTIYLLGLGWANGWVLFESAHHLPAGYEPGKLFQNPQLTHNVPTGYIVLCPQCLEALAADSCFAGGEQVVIDLSDWEDEPDRDRNGDDRNGDGDAPNRKCPNRSYSVITVLQEW